ncbi:MAG: DUF5803 family protein [Halobacteriota archaeon]
MNRRLLLGVVALAVLTATAGCFGFGTGPVDDATLDEQPTGPYAWDADADVHITLTTSADFRAVYTLNQSEIRLYRNDGFGGRNPLTVSAVRLQYPNGTVINGSTFDERGGEIRKTRNVLIVGLPQNAPNGSKLAFTSPSTPKRFSLPVYVEGSYEAVLPPDRRVDVFPFGSVTPRDYETDTVDGQDHIRWEDVTTDTVVIQYYLQRDLYIFAGIAAVLSVIGLVGLAYYRRQLEALRRRREEMGLGPNPDEDSRRNRPP